MKPFLDILPHIKAAAFSHCYHPRVDALCGCGTDDKALYRCTLCNHHPLCQTCILNTHRHTPFHRIERWNGMFFESTSLRALGYVFSLGHNSDPCPSSSSHRRITVVDTNGYHDIEVQLCQCRHRLALKLNHEDANQFLLARLWPMSVENPQTVITFGCVEEFIMHSNTSKLTAYDYCWSLRRFTDAVEPLQVSVSSFSLHCVLDLKVYRIVTRT